MNKERKTDPRTQIRRNYVFRKMLKARRQSQYWRERWKTHPETMRNNLDSLNRARKEKAAERTKRLLAILGKCPEQIASWDLRKTLLEAITSSGYSVTPTSSTVLLSALRRRKLIAYHSESMTWRKVVC